MVWMCCDISLQYESEAKLNPLNYDIWFDFVKLEEANGNHERIRDVYERAIANVPPVMEKDAWRRYVYLWIQYALYEELIAEVHSMRWWNYVAFFA